MILQQQQLQSAKKHSNIVVLPLKRCGKCKENVIEMFKTPVQDMTSYENLLYEILQNKDLVVKFEDFCISCSSCGETHKDITYIQLDKEDIELLNKTLLSNIWITVF